MIDYERMYGEIFDSKVRKSGKPKNLKEELECIASINRDYGRIKETEYTKYIFINGKIVRGCSSCYGLYMKCPDAFSDVAHLCNSFDETPMLCLEDNNESIYGKF